MKGIALLWVAIMASCAAGNVLEHPAKGSAALREDLDDCRAAEGQRARGFDPDAQFIMQDRVLDCMKQKGYVSRPVRWGESATEY